MNCDEARRHWNLYHDSEGDAALYLRINEHLATCAACKSWFAAHSRIEEQVNAELAPVAPTAELWATVLGRSNLHQTAGGKRWYFTGALLAVAASLLLVVGLWSQRGGADAADLSQLTAGWHRQLVDGRIDVDFASGSDLAVEGYLRQRVKFPVRCPPREDAGFRVDGAGVCLLDDNEAAYLTGRVEGEPVSIFILPRESLTRFPLQYEAVRREGTHRSQQGVYDMVMGEIDRNVVLVIGKTDTDRLLRVLNAYGTYPGPHHG